MTKVAREVGRTPWSARVPLDPLFAQVQEAGEGVERGSL
jgi:hypothetical protein